MNAFEGRGGLRVEIMKPGKISVGDVLSLEMEIGP
jgi:MOSC domain-containing protein YiiM